MADSELTRSQAVARLASVRNSNRALRAVAGDSASFKAVATVATGGAVAGVAARTLPRTNLVGPISTHTVVGFGLALLGVGAGSPMAVDAAGGFLAGAIAIDVLTAQKGE